MYQALYRKWRPQTFDEVIGQEHITETLKNQVKSGRLSHAYLFIGTRGTGKTTCARILARAVNCEHPVDGNPCGKCAACRGILDGSVMDVVELDAASNNGVDNVRALREEATFTPSAVKKRVYIIDEVHMLSASAFNALLKILEEPPEHLMFILATTELQKVPATILSRCQRHSFHRIDAATIAVYLGRIAAKEGMKLSPEAAGLISRMADGGMRDALSLLDQCSARETIDEEAVFSAMGLAGNLRIARLLDLILKHDAPAALQTFAGLWMDGKDPASLLTELTGLLRDVLMMHIAPDGAKDLISGGYGETQLRAIARSMTSEELLAALDTLQASLSSLRTAGNPKTVAELCLISLCQHADGDSVRSLRARISRLEEQLAHGVPAMEEVDFYPAPSRREEHEDDPDDDGREEEEDDLPAIFHEDQPEDEIVSYDSPAQAYAPEAKPQPPKPEAPRSAPAPTAEIWPAVCEKIQQRLPRDLRVSLGERNKVRGVTEADCLWLEVVPGFLYSRFNRQEILQLFAEAAREAAGVPMRVLVRELKPEAHQQRDIEELRQFKEVHFINE